MALTGATGFVGSHVARVLVDQGYHVRALARGHTRSVLPHPIETCCGSLEDAPSLERLITGARWVVHCAGKIKARSEVEFTAANVQGTGRLIEAMKRVAPAARLIAMSSLAAREPQLSAYASSKRQAEELVAKSLDPTRHVSIRPPAIYGPGDRNTLPILAQLAKGTILVPGAPANRFSLLHVQDLAELVALVLRSGATASPPIEPDDGTAGGYRWADLALIAERTSRKRTRAIGMPRWLFRGVAPATELLARLTGSAPVLPRDKIAELFHPDWVADPTTMAHIAWSARTRFDKGFATTLAWYYQAGWLRGAAPIELAADDRGTPRA